MIVWMYLAVFVFLYLCIIGSTLANCSIAHQSGLVIMPSSSWHSLVPFFPIAKLPFGFPPEISHEIFGFIEKRVQQVHFKLVLNLRAISLTSPGLVNR